jgi:CHASE2 domain-containing sensor protein
MCQIIKFIGFTLCGSHTMTFLGFLYHLMGFVAPALVVAAVLGVALRRRPTRQGWPAYRQYRWLAGVGVVVLLLGWALTGADGRMATYAALVVSQGGFAAWLQRR